MAKLFKFIIPVLIIVVAVVVANVMISNRAPAERQAPRPPVPVVKAIVVQPADYQIIVESQGVVRARTRITLVAQVGGKVIRINPDFRDGGFFSANETLVRIDPRDYRAAVTIAESELARAQQTLAEEEARTVQAERDWQRLGGGEQPSDLTLRKPQLAAARANLQAAEARLVQARLNLERTSISVPYDGRVLSQQVDVGQVVAGGTVVGEVYATEAVEVRLPLSNLQLAQLVIPEEYRQQDKSARGPAVELSARVGQQRHVWQGRIVRSEGAIDAQSRQHFVVAQVDKPYAARDSDRPPLKVGQYVEAGIRGRTLENVFVIPASAVKGEVFAYVVDENQSLSERALDIRWRAGNEIVVAAGLKAGERLVTTVPAGAVDGMRVRLHDQAAAAKQAKPKP